ncbi:hypothetical protein I6A60_19515 [Frankia sp. AgB1.9]|nr:hypothetical protein [Frankia sp. AgW1.1]MBL7550051.1 hypothetical protein [Frankia sp. AgB1.9]
MTAVAVALGPGSPAGATPPTGHVTGTLPDGAQYVMDVPANWNGTVLLFSHGIVPAGLGLPNPPTNSLGNGDGPVLLAKGYALVGSSYATEGWAVEQAIPDQLDTLALFQEKFGPARHTIAWGASMGGMITTAIAEQHPEVIDGSLAMCGLEMGGVAEWNALLDSSFAFKALLAPQSGVALTHLGDLSAAEASAAAFSKVAATAQTTPAGRARIALAAALYDAPAYNTPGQTVPAPGDWATAEVNQESDLVSQVFTAQFILRAEAEERAGGNMSWNTGVDYGALLARSAYGQEVVALYQKAGLSLSADLATVNRASRINVEPAMAYMERYVSFDGELRKPQLDIHTIGDGLVPVTGESAYRDATIVAGRADLLRQAYVNSPGHCNFTAGEVTAAVDTIDHRVQTGVWGGSASPAALNSLAHRDVPSGTANYVAYQPSPYLRPFNLLP